MPKRKFILFSTVVILLLFTAACSQVINSAVFGSVQDRFGRLVGEKQGGLSDMTNLTEVADELGNYKLLGFTTLGNFVNLAVFAFVYRDNADNKNIILHRIDQSMIAAFNFV